MDRLVKEWKKPVQTAGAKVRSKRAIIGRRQNPQYKKVLAELTKEITHDNDRNGTVTSHEKNDNDYQNERADEQDKLAGHIFYERKIREYMKQHYLDTK